jgi:hypothetical protein
MERYMVVYGHSTENVQVLRWVRQQDALDEGYELARKGYRVIEVWGEASGCIQDDFGQPGKETPWSPNTAVSAA